LSRGSRDDFEAKEFHSRCDGQTNTRTVILETHGNIFGGFTPLESESSATWKYRAEASLKSLIFTLRNPHNVGARRFALKAEKKDKAIFCDSGRTIILVPVKRDADSSAIMTKNLQS
jgi:hypothetical protein